MKFRFSILISLLAILLVAAECSGVAPDPGFGVNVTDEYVSVINEPSSTFTWSGFWDATNGFVQGNYTGDALISSYAIDTTDGEFNVAIHRNVTVPVIDGSITVPDTYRGLGEEWFPGSTWVPGDSWIPGSDWVPGDSWIPGSDWVPGSQWVPGARWVEELIALPGNRVFVIWVAPAGSDLLPQDVRIQPFAIGFEPAP